MLGITAIFLDGPYALTSHDVPYMPKIEMAILKPPAEQWYSRVTMEPVCERITYYLVGLGVEKKIGLYSLVPGDRSLLQLTIEREDWISVRFSGVTRIAR